MAEGKILIVDDDKTLLDSLKSKLMEESYAVVTAVDGVQALELARTEKPALIILDITLPKLNGLQVCRILRKEMTAPIMILTSKTEEIDKVIALELGADDYLTKPFSPRELLARIRAMLRRVEMTNQKTLPKQEIIPETIKIANLTIDFAGRQVSRGKSTVNLTPREYELLAFLVRNRGEVFSRDRLLEKVWGYDYAGNTRMVDYHILSLRRKIEDDRTHPVHLVTVRGAGYKFEG
ncbi:MAG: response regulator [Dehalococcoidia bacterium]